MRWNCMSKALRFLQITAKPHDFPFLTVFLTVKTSSQNISIKLSQILLKLCKNREDPIGEKNSCERFSVVRFPVSKIFNIAEVKYVMAWFRCYDNSDVIATLIMTNFHLLGWQFFLMFVCEDVVYAQIWYWPWKLYRATFICQYGLCCCNMAVVSYWLFCKNLGHLREFFGQMVCALKII